MKTVILRHNMSGGAGIFRMALEARGLPFTVVSSYNEDMSCFNAEEPDLLIVMGGAPGVYQADLYPFIRHEIDIVEKRAAKGLPTMGICLGGQIMARALGAKVYKGRHGSEIGWRPIYLTEEGKRSPIAHLGHDKTSMVHWHGDEFELPEGATLLAYSDQYPHQCFRWGKNFLGFQCHPEATWEKMQDSLVNSAGDAAEGTIDILRIRRETEQYMDTLNRQSEKFFLEWIESIGLCPKRHLPQEAAQEEATLLHA